MNYKVYILFSKSKNRFYIGYTADLEERIKRHNQKSKGFTGSNNDWELVYQEQFLINSAPNRSRLLSNHFPAFCSNLFEGEKSSKRISTAIGGKTSSLGIGLTLGILKNQNNFNCCNLNCIIFSALKKLDKLGDI
jgi:hypothetical protein